jgi:hypothetical protein
MLVSESEIRVIIYRWSEQVCADGWFHGSFVAWNKRHPGVGVIL